MRYTNELGLPQPIFDAVTNDPYSKGDCKYSISGLLKPARIAGLERLYSDELVEDVADRIYSLLGQSVHNILERSEREAFAEERLYGEVNGVRISGKGDRFVYYDHLLQDYKVTSLYKTKGGVPIEWEQQLNAYVWLWETNGFPVKRAEVVAIYRDWHLATARRGFEGYPLRQAERIAVPLWPKAAQLHFLTRRVAVHDAAQVATSQDDLPYCTPEEMWADPPQWAVLKKGNKRAVRLYDKEEDAFKHLQAFPLEDYTIEHRPSKPKRCADWCSVSKFCKQYKEMDEAAR